MRYASDFRKAAREGLSGKWGVAVVAGLLASLLGGAAMEGIQFNINLDSGDLSGSLNLAGQEILHIDDGIIQRIAGMLLGGLLIFLVVGLVMGVIYFILGSFVSVGYAQFNLELVDRVKEPELGKLFSHFKNWRTTAVASLLQTVYIILWSLLFVIPGIVAGYSYAMTNYILAEHPELSASEAIRRSKDMMYGNRWRLFCLEFSFIGWELLSTLTLGIGQLWLLPYREAARAAFYREITTEGTSYVYEDDEDEDD